MKYLFLSLFILFTMTNSRSQDTELLQLLPDVPKDWKKIVDNKLYNTESLYEYINGGAELYLSYNMSEVASMIIGKNDTEIRVEVFDMTEPENAFGVFTHTRTTNENKFGQGSQYFTGAQIFWKGRYFVALTANDENDEITTILKQLAQSIETKINDTGSKPVVVHTLPAEGMQPDGFVYFKHYIWLNSYYFIANENILNINSDTDAVLAKYGDAENRYYLLVIDYPSTDKASAASKNFQDELLDGEKEITRIEDKGWLGLKQIGNSLVAVLNAPDTQSVSDLLEKTSLQIQKTAP